MKPCDKPYECSYCPYHGMCEIERLHPNQQGKASYEDRIAHPEKYTGKEY